MLELVVGEAPPWPPGSAPCSSAASLGGVAAQRPVPTPEPAQALRFFLSSRHLLSCLPLGGDSLPREKDTLFRPGHLPGPGVPCTRPGGQSRKIPVSRGGWKVWGGQMSKTPRPLSEVPLAPLFLPKYTCSPSPSYFSDSWQSFSFPLFIHSLIRSLRQYSSNTCHVLVRL